MPLGVVHKLPQMVSLRLIDNICLWGPRLNYYGVGHRRWKRKEQIILMKLLVVRNCMITTFCTQSFYTAHMYRNKTAYSKMTVIDETAYLICGNLKWSHIGFLRKEYNDVTCFSSGQFQNILFYPFHTHVNFNLFYCSWPNSYKILSCVQFHKIESFH